MTADRRHQIDQRNVIDAYQKLVDAQRAVIARLRRENHELTLRCAAESLTTDPDPESDLDETQQIEQRMAWLAREIADQRQWIYDCECNGKSYAGPNGANIRHADISQLQLLISEYRRLRESGYTARAHLPLPPR